MPECIFEFTGGLPLMHCELANKHKVTLPVKALVDTSSIASKSASGYGVLWVSISWSPGEPMILINRSVKNVLPGA